MEYHLIKALDISSDYLKKELEPMCIVKYLINGETITYEDRQKLRQQTTRESRVSLLTAIIQKKGNKAFQKFLQATKDSKHHRYIGEKLQIVSKKLLEKFCKDVTDTISLTKTEQPFTTWKILFKIVENLRIVQVDQGLVVTIANKQNPKMKDALSMVRKKGVMSIGNMNDLKDALEKLNLLDLVGSKLFDDFSNEYFYPEFTLQVTGRLGEKLPLIIPSFLKKESNSFKLHLSLSIFLEETYGLCLAYFRENKDNENMKELVLKVPTRVALENLCDKISRCEFAQAIGLLLQDSMQTEKWEDHQLEIKYDRKELDVLRRTMKERGQNGDLSAPRIATKDEGELDQTSEVFNSIGYLDLLCNIKEILDEQKIPDLESFLCFQPEEEDKKDKLDKKTSFIHICRKKGIITPKRISKLQEAFSYFDMVELRDIVEDHRKILTYPEITITLHSREDVSIRKLSDGKPQVLKTSMLKQIKEKIKNKKFTNSWQLRTLFLYEYSAHYMREVENQKSIVFFLRVPTLDASDNISNDAKSDVLLGKMYPHLLSGGTQQYKIEDVLKELYVSVDGNLFPSSSKEASQKNYFSMKEIPAGALKHIQKELEPICILKYLTSKKIMTNEDQTRITQKTTRAERVEAMLRLLKEKGSETFPFLISALQDCGYYESILDRLAKHKMVADHINSQGANEDQSERHTSLVRRDAKESAGQTTAYHEDQFQAEKKTECAHKINDEKQKCSNSDVSFTVEEALNYCSEISKIILTFPIQQMEDDYVFHELVIDELRDTAELTESNRRIKNIGVIGGSATSIAGAVTAIIGAAVTPFTLGAGIPLIVTGTAVGLGGSGVGIGFTVHKLLKDKERRKMVEPNLQKYIALIENMTTIIVAICNTNKVIERLQSAAENQDTLPNMPAIAGPAFARAIAKAKAIKEDIEVQIKTAVREHVKGEKFHQQMAIAKYYCLVVIDLIKQIMNNIPNIEDEDKEYVEKSISEVTENVFDSLITSVEKTIVNICRDEHQKTSSFAEFAFKVFNNDITKNNSIAPPVGIAVAETGKLVGKAGATGGRVAFRILNMTDDVAKVPINSLRIANAVSGAGIALGVIGIAVDVAFLGHAIYDLSKSTKEEFSQALLNIADIMECMEIATK